MLRKKRLVIVNADDFGFSADTVAATVECLERGLVSSATIMANMPFCRQAAEYARLDDDHSYGVHLCLTDEVPVSEPRSIPSLVDQDGRLWKTRVFLGRAFLGLLARDEIEREADAQIARLKSLGVQLTHIDSHGHIHKARQVSAALQRVMSRHGLRILRRPQDIFYRGCRVVSRVLNSLALARIRTFSIATDHFLMATGSLKPSDKDWWHRVIQNLPAGVTEVGVHPGQQEEWQLAETVPLLEDDGRTLARSGVALVDFRILLRGSVHEM